jgi:hypothetical protein
MAANSQITNVKAQPLSAQLFGSSGSRLSGIGAVCRSRRMSAMGRSEAASLGGKRTSDKRSCGLLIADVFSVWVGGEPQTEGQSWHDYCQSQVSAPV